jgi:hypothetical protein
VSSDKATGHNPQVQKIVTLATVIELCDVGMSVVAENVNDINRSFLDNVRVMCDGASQITGFDNAMGKTVRHSCHLFPNLFRAMLTLITVLFADYSVMNCVCKQGEEQKRVEAIEE